MHLLPTLGGGRPAARPRPLPIVNTTASCRPTTSSVSAGTAVTFTAGFSSATRGAHTAARALPRSASVRKKLLPSPGLHLGPKRRLESHRLQGCDTLGNAVQTGEHPARCREVRAPETGPIH